MSSSMWSIVNGFVGRTSSACQGKIGAVLLAGLLITASGSLLCADDELQQALRSIQQVDKQAAGHPEAMTAWKTMVQQDAGALAEILQGMNDANPLANNWIRAAVDTIAERTIQDGGSLPAAALEAHVADRTQSARSRRLAFEWLTRVDPTARDRWIDKLLDDPSLELRRDAVAHALANAAERAAALASENDKTPAVASYTTALTYARDLDQVNAAADALRDLGHPVDLPRHFGFITDWHIIGPFDNTDTQGFDQVYPPEIDVELSAEYPGKTESVRWQAATTDDSYGKLDLNASLGKHKGACAYAVAEFFGSEAQPVELRLGSMNANKVWLNGQLLTANHVYHSGDSIDQYVGKGALVKGKNTILLKICQNEQTESWAQDWAFQLRVCDDLGTAVLSSEAP